jgi:hypothetical protein
MKVRPVRESKPILCLDFDGVIHSYKSGWQGATVINDPPVEGALEFVIRALLDFQVVVFSSRSHQIGGITAMREYMSAYGFPVDQIQFGTNKPSALVTLDDRAVTFTGNWPSVEDLLNFKPWNRK